EAERLLPVVAGYLEQARQFAQRLHDLDEELGQAVVKIMALGGSIPPSAALAEKKSERQEIENELREVVGRIQQTGCIVRDLEVGLLDFPSLRDGEEVSLCWKLGEQRIEYYHSIHEGFAGRKPLEQPKSDEPPEGPQRVH